VYGEARLRVVSQTNGGKATALNTGIAAARGEIVLCMDGDSILEPQTLQEAVKHFKDPTVGAVAGNVKVANRLNALTRLQALEYIEGFSRGAPRTPSSGARGGDPARSGCFASA
jgi:cellulose synthase/poly-beta-1,6-N-acetylglucosamine synthase-like glycosyltransferase